MADDPDTILPSDLPERGDDVQADQRVVNTQGGDYAEGDIDKRQWTFVAGDQFDMSGDFRGATVYAKSTIYPWEPPQPADPQTIAAAQGLLAQLPTDALPPHATLPPGSKMPLERNPLFVGREPDLLALARALKTGGAAAIVPTAAITGLGGIGKTNLATEFVHRYGPFFAGGVYWLSFAEPGAIPREIAACGGEGGMQLRPDFADLSLDEQVAAVQRAWADPLPRLLVFDNCDGDDAEALVQQYHPKTGGCRVLLTSRRAHWDAALNIAALALDILPRHESIALLRSLRADLAEQDADALAAELGDLPLALHLAGSFLRVFADLAAADYLAELRGAALLEHESLQGSDLGVSPTNHVLHVGRTFELSYKRLRPDNPVDGLARTLLAGAAYCAPGEPIPRAVLLATVAPADAAAERQAARALDRLGALGLLTSFAGGALSLHRLLAAFVRQQPAPPEVLGTTATALANYSQALQDAGQITQSLALVPHLERVLAHQADALGAEHPDTLRTAHNLALTLSSQGDYAAARARFEAVLEAYTRRLGAEHPATLTTAHNLALTLASQGDYAAARARFEAVLEARTRRLGAEHPATLTTAHNLALTLASQGDYAAARARFEAVLEAHTRLLGAEHPDTLTTALGLADTLFSQGDYAAARARFEAVLEARTRLLGAEHPATLGTAVGLANTLASQGDYAAARARFEAVLEALTRRLGAEHPDTLRTAYNLALTLASLRADRTYVPNAHLAHPDALHGAERVC
jgi:tetratricopeptide (TPR) repeat protein